MLAFSTEKSQASCLKYPYFGHKSVLLHLKPAGSFSLLTYLNVMLVTDCVDKCPGACWGWVFIFSKINTVKIIVTIETSKGTGKSKKNMFFLQ